MRGTSVSGQDTKAGTEFAVTSETTRRDKIYKVRDFETLDTGQQRTMIDETQEANEVSPMTAQLSCPMKMSKSPLRGGNPGGAWPTP